MRGGRLRILIFILCLGTLALSIACGGGGGSGSGTPPPSPPPPSPPLTITTTSILPGALTGRAYSTSLTAVNGQGALHWSISPVSPTTLFVNGLSIDPISGALSGTASFNGTAGFTAQVTDSASPPQAATRAFTVTASGPLTVAPSQTITVSEFGGVNFASLAGLQGGVRPLMFALTGGALPPGIRLNGTTGQLTGPALATGTFISTITVQDSFTAPEVVSQQVTIIVVPPALSVAPSIPSRMPLNRPFSGSAIAMGGIPPYSFALSFGSLPPGLGAIDPNSGVVSGTPTAAGTYSFNVRVTDSSSPSQTAFGFFNVTVAPPQGRNDGPATATPISNGPASISPYEDPPNGPPVAGDNDYYKIVSLAGATVHVETQAKRFNPSNPLDTVIEIVDGNGIRLNTCRQPGDTSLNFTSACLNDDISASPHIQDSALDFFVAGPTNTPTTFYLHVLDWRGDARPDMTYSLQFSGIKYPISIIGSGFLLPAANGLSYYQQLSSTNAIGAVTWSLAGSTTLPPGLMLSPDGVISGVATTNGDYTFTVQASDSGAPQTATAQETIKVVDPVKITSSPALTDACAGQPYSYTIQTFGGQPPLVWDLQQPLPGIPFFFFGGVFTGTTTQLGTFTGTVTVTDRTLHSDLQNITLTVKQCGP